MPAADGSERRRRPEFVTAPRYPADGRLSHGEDGLEALDPQRHQAVAAVAGDRLDLAELIDPEDQLRVAARVRADEFDLEHGTDGPDRVGRQSATSTLPA